MRASSACLGKLGEEALRQLVAALRSRDDFVVPRHAFGLVVADAAADQIELVAEVVVKDAVSERGILRDLAQAGAREAELCQRFQRGIGQLDPSRIELLVA